MKGREMFDLHKEICNLVKEPSHVSKIGDLIKFVKKYDKKIDFDIKIDNMNISQQATLMLILPFKFSKRIVEIGKQVLPVFIDCPNVVKINMAMRVIRAAALANLLQNLYQSRLIQDLYKKNKTIFNLPMLYLAAQSIHPDPSLGPVISMSSRNDVLQFYYSGINKMNLNDFTGADVDFLKSLTISRALEFNEATQYIVEKLSLSSFLSHTQHDVYLKRVPIWLRPKGIYAKIWDLSSNFSNSDFDSFMDAFSSEILRERTRRIIIDLALTTSQVKVDRFISLCGVSVDEARKVTQNEVEIVLENDTVTFNGPYLIEKIQDQIKDLTQIIVSLNE